MSSYLSILSCTRHMHIFSLARSSNTLVYSPCNNNEPLYQGKMRGMSRGRIAVNVGMTPPDLGLMWQGGGSSVVLAGSPHKLNRFGS